MNFVYAAMGFAIGLMLLIFMVKENKAFYFFSFVFVFMGSWWLLDGITDFNFFQGDLLLVFRVIMAVSIVVAIIVYFREKKLVATKNSNNQYEKKD